MGDEWNAEVASKLARRLVHCAREGALGTLGEGGQPHVSHVATATLCDGAPVLLVSDLAVHTKNLKRDPRASLLFVEPPAGEGDTNARARVTLDGTLAAVADPAGARARFMRRQPEAAGYADFGDFQFVRLAPQSAYLVAGFGRITPLSPAALLSDPEAAAALAEIDAGACAHMDEDHADAMALIANRLLGAPHGVWRAVGLDPLGIDMAQGDTVVRAEFDTPVSGSGPLRKALAQITERARAA
ncbi:MAG: pyridoxamine 5'-phosphate oxidase family protein [Pseudomonadota bacterium]